MQRELLAEIYENNVKVQQLCASLDLKGIPERDYLPLIEQIIAEVWYGC